ncbi:MAG: hypothetical protein AAB407_02070 [Patescibacteria group bacterium]
MLFLIRVPESYRGTSDNSRDCFNIVHEFDAESLDEAVDLFGAWIRESRRMCSNKKIELIPVSPIAIMRNGVLENYAPRASTSQAKNVRLNGHK